MRSGGSRDVLALPRRWELGILHFAQRCLERFVSMDGFDRSMALAAQAFTALFPLLIVVAAAAEAGDGGSLGEQVVDRFGLTGAAADSVQRAFPTAGTITDSITAISAAILVISALSFARALQRLYERAWLLDARGVRDTAWSLLWLLGVSLYALAHILLHGHIGHDEGLLASIAGGAVVWTLTPYVVLARRLAWRLLLLQAVLAAVGMTILRAASAIYMPHALASAAEQFGTIGVAFALVGWLFSAAVVLTVSAASGAVAMERRR
jgi:membrane protein